MTSSQHGPRREDRAGDFENSPHSRQDVHASPTKGLDGDVDVGQVIEQLVEPAAGASKLVKYLIAAVSTVAVVSTTLVAVNWLNQPVVNSGKNDVVAAQGQQSQASIDEPLPSPRPLQPPPSKLPPLEDSPLEDSPPPTDVAKKFNRPSPPAGDSPESPREPASLVTKKPRFRETAEKTNPGVPVATAPPNPLPLNPQPPKPKSPRTNLADDPLREPEGADGPVAKPKTKPRTVATKTPRRSPEEPSREPIRTERERPLADPPEPRVVVTRRRPPTVVVQRGGTGGVVERRGVWTSQVVDPGVPIQTISDFDVVDLGTTTISRRRPVRPIETRSSVDWERLLSSLLLEVVTRLDNPSNISNGGSTGRLDATPASFSGLIFVRRGVNGAPTHRIKFLDTANYQFENVPAPGSSVNAAPEKGKFTVADQLLTLTPELRSQNVRRLTVSKYRLNTDGKRSLQLGNDLWEQEVASPPPAGLVASFDTLKGKVFSRTSVGNLQRLALGDDGAFVYVSASTDPQKRGAPMRVVRGKFSVAAKNLSFTRTTSEPFPAPLGDVWPIGDLQRGPDGKHIIGLNREEWDEELPIAGTPIGPIEPSPATLGGRAFTWADNQGANYRIEFALNGAFSFRMTGVARTLATSGVYEVRPNELRLTFRNPQSLASVVNVNGPWPIQDYQMNVDGKRTIRIQAGLASPPEPIWVESP